MKKEYEVPTIKELAFDNLANAQGACNPAGSGDATDCSTGTAPQGGTGSCKAGNSAAGMCMAGSNL